MAKTEPAQRGRALDAQQERFVWVWNAAESLAEAAAELNLPPQTAVRRAGYLRSTGADLKRFPPLTREPPKPARPPEPTGPPEPLPELPADLPPWQARFAKAWNEAVSIGHLSMRYGVSVETVTWRGRYLRRKGIPMKVFPTEQPPRPPRPRKSKRGTAKPGKTKPPAE